MPTLRQLWELSLYQRSILVILLICNVLGTIYGFIWYGDQLLKTQWHYLIFVPDSPIASLFLCISICLIILNKQNSIIEGLAFVTLFKYGLWAVIMNFIMIINNDDITIMNVFLIISHGIMVLESIYFYPRFNISMLSLFISMIWVFNNDYVDYILKKYPYYDFIQQHVHLVAFIALWLSIISLILYYNFNKLIKVKLFDKKIDSQ